MHGTWGKQTGVVKSLYAVVELLILTVSWKHGGIAHVTTALPCGGIDPLGRAGCYRETAFTFKKAEISGVLPWDRQCSSLRLIGED